MKPAANITFFITYENKIKIIKFPTTLLPIK